MSQLLFFARTHDVSSRASGKPLAALTVGGPAVQQLLDILGQVEHGGGA
ncbi:hypothetical protein [Pseudomonas sp. REB1044]